MPNDPNTKTIDLYQLIADANLSIGFSEGEGLGAVFLTMVAIIFILSRPFRWRGWIMLAQRWRGKPQPPAE